jgi:hypothetical protein
MPGARRLLFAGLLAGLVAACTSTGPPAAARGAERLEPLMPGWERFFKLDWEIGERRGRPVVSGYLANDSPYEVTGVRLLVDGLDEAGAIVAQGVSWVPVGRLGPFSRVYFEAPAPGRHPRYQVRVFSYDRIERDGGRFDRFP